MLFGLLNQNFELTIKNYFKKLRDTFNVKDLYNKLEYIYNYSGFITIKQ